MDTEALVELQKLHAEKAEAALDVDPTEGAKPAPDKPQDGSVTEHDDDDPDAELDSTEDELD